MALPIPESAEDLNAGWFSSLLNIDVDSVSVTAIGEGAGMMSRLFRVELEYGEGHGPDSVVVKIPTAMQQNRDIAVQFDNYCREVEFYQKGAGKTPMRTAQTYLAETDGPDNFVLVLEDFSDWEQGDQVEGCSLPRAEAVMDSLAALHASFWQKVDAGDMEWLPNSYPSVMSDGLMAGTEAAWDDFARFFADDLTAELKHAKTAYLRGLPGVLRYISESPRTVIHGDFRMDNLFFLPGDKGIEVACCDWQAPVRGKGIQDVAYFLSGSIETDMRREHETALLKRWLDALTNRGVQDYPFEQVLHDYRMGILMLWTYVVVVGGGLAAENQRGTNWVTAMVRRSAAAMTDHDCLSLLD